MLLFCQAKQTNIKLASAAFIFQKRVDFMVTVAEQLAKTLCAMGVKKVFGIPGGPSLPYIAALREEGIDFITTANEQSAAIIADVHGRLTGIPGVCHATFGPGATNLATGVGEALLDRSPLIALTTEVSDEDIGRKIQMNIDHQALFKPITKWTTRLSADNFKDTIETAFQIATSELPGPVHIGLPVNCAGKMVKDGLQVNLTKKIDHEPADDLLQKAGDLLKQAKRPVLAIGLTAVRQQLQPLVREFVDKNKIPVLLTPMAKGIIKADHDCYLGVLFHAKSDMLEEIYRDADLVIGLGYDAVEYNYESWMPNVPLIHIDSQPANLLQGFEVACDITGMLKPALLYLNSLQLPSYSWDWKKISDLKQRLWSALIPNRTNFTPSQLITILQEELPSESIVTGDVGAHLHLLGQLWKPDTSNTLLMTNGWSAMGFGIPAAIGAKLCKPDSNVVCVTGDGGFLMNCGEILTARRLGLSFLTIVISDNYLSLIKVKQKRRYGKTYGMRLVDGDLFESERFLGAKIIKVTNTNEMRSALRQAFKTVGPIIIEAIVDGSDYEELISVK